MCLEVVKLLEYGIDVSEFQDNIDWAKVKNGGSRITHSRSTAINLIAPRSTRFPSF